MGIFSTSVGIACGVWYAHLVQNKFESLWLLTGLHNHADNGMAGHMFDSNTDHTHAALQDCNMLCRNMSQEDHGRVSDAG